ncbi:MAG: ATP-dependent DNA helicase DinG [Spirochaetaceae bacterium]|jgi:ATP-dependent DNA helicase DinG|nr:ATP-dependent DNA helicase DinG [Spirochaetaceae bacterium]
MKAYLDADEICAALEDGGEIAARIPHYESRQEQFNLTRLIIRGFNEEAIVAAEAGTGIGKSFAYLLPAIRCAQTAKNRIVISTATINLQHQLFEKDIPFLLDVYSGTEEEDGTADEKIKAVLVKGRGNFLCLRRLRFTADEIAAQKELFSDADRDIFDDIFHWAEQTKTGEKSSLPFLPPARLWAQIASDSDSCMNARCLYFANCFYMKNRREAENASILVVNHHVLFADLAVRYDCAGYDGTAVLPSYRYVILDEAHRIEEAATSFFSNSMNKNGLSRLISRLYRRKGAQESGLLVKLRSAAPPAGSASFTESALCNKVLDDLDELDNAALVLCGAESVFRFVAGREGLIQSRLVPPLNNLRSRILELCAALNTIMKNYSNTKENADDEETPPVSAQIDSTVWEARSCLRSLQNAASLCEDFLRYREKPDRVLWIERRGSTGNRNDYAMWTSAPLKLDTVLAEALFTPFKSVIAVSATLSVAGDFAYWGGRVGLNSASKPFLTGVFPSPFPYDKAVLLAIPHDAPPPNCAGMAYQDFIGMAIYRLCHIAGGGALVLFTSYESLRIAYAYCENRLEEANIPVFKQGDDDRARLLRHFLENKESVLFATDSFWEGIDAPGDTLRLVIICRLPFISPSDPVLEARCEDLEREGQNSFMCLSVPEAVIKFRQGFGRLMRRSTDRGVVAVLDSRIIQKFYGKLFFDSLPPTKRSIAPFPELERSVESFLNS